MKKHMNFEKFYKSQYPQNVGALILDYYEKNQNASGNDFLKIGELSQELIEKDTYSNEFFVNHMGFNEIATKYGLQRISVYTRVKRTIDQVIANIGVLSIIEKIEDNNPEILDDKKPDIISDPILNILNKVDLREITDLNGFDMLNFITHGITKDEFRQLIRSARENNVKLSIKSNPYKLKGILRSRWNKFIKDFYGYPKNIYVEGLRISNLSKLPEDLISFDDLITKVSLRTKINEESLIQYLELFYKECDSVSTIATKLSEPAPTLTVKHHKIADAVYEILNEPEEITPHEPLIKDIKGISSKAIKTLQEMEIFKIEDLSRITLTDFKNLPGINRNVIRPTLDLMDEYGFSFKKEIEEDEDYCGDVVVRTDLVTTKEDGWECPKCKYKRNFGSFCFKCGENIPDKYITSETNYEFLAFVKISVKHKVHKLAIVVRATSKERAKDDLIDFCRKEYTGCLVEIGSIRVIPKIGKVPLRVVI